MPHPMYDFLSNMKNDSSRGFLKIVKSPLFGPYLVMYNLPYRESWKSFQTRLYFHHPICQTVIKNVDNISTG